MRWQILLVSSCLAAAASLTGHSRAIEHTDPRSLAGLPLFEDFTQAAGIDFHHTNGATPEKYMVETMGSGGLFFDYNRDGWLDIFLVDGGSVANPAVAARARHALLKNRGDGTFEDVTGASRIVHREYGMGACAADYDNDGWTDLYVTNYGPNMLYRNDGKGAFADVTSAAGVGSPLWSASCAFSDVDNDGDLDLFVTNYVDWSVNNNKFCGDPKAGVRAYCHPNIFNGLPSVLYRNNGDGTFTDITREAGLYTTDSKALGVVFGDFDGDGWRDLFVANDSVPNFLYRNEGHGKFSEVGLVAGVAVASDGKSRAGMGADFGDYNGDGLLDVVVTNLDGQTHSLFKNLGEGLFDDATFESGVGEATKPFVGFGAVFFDYDNDGHLDLAIADGDVLDNASFFRPAASYPQRNLLFRNDGAGHLQEVGLTSGRGFALVKVSRGLQAGDIDNDGDLDLLVTNNGQTADLLRNDGGNRNNALLVRTVGARSNRDGVGAVVRLTVAGKTEIREVKAGSSYLGQGDLRVHFGLGQAPRADRLEIWWPGGDTEVIENLEANQIVTVTEGHGVVDRRPFRTSSSTRAGSPSAGSAR